MLSGVAASVEFDGCRQAGNLLIVLRDNVGNHGVFSGRNLSWKIDLFGESSLVILLQRAFEIDVLNVVAEVDGLSNDGDEAVFDL